MRVMSKILNRISFLFLFAAVKKSTETRGSAETGKPESQKAGFPAFQLIPLCLRAFVAVFSVLLISHTSSAWSATISGKVEIEGRKDMSGVLVTVQEESLSGITSKDGTYSIPDIPSGRFTLIAQKAGCLVEVRSDVVVRDESVVVDFQLVPGDLKIDNQINLLDRIMLTSAWQAKEGDANWDSMLDIYEDGVIDEKDKELLISRWREGNPNIKLGSLEVSSEPNGAAILINGADTGQITPYSFRGMVAGEYMITLALTGYAPKDITASVEAGETAELSPEDRILDNQPPEFADWAQDPANLTEDTQGELRVSVRVVDRGGSGLAGKVPQFDYHIGTTFVYDGYEDMTLESGDVWYYEIPEPVESWDAYRGKYVYYKAKAEDVAGNEAESTEQSELIDDINDSPTVRITSTFDVWERGLLTIGAETSDKDGTIAGVQFEYSFDNARWTQIGSTDTTRPYSVAWDTTTVVREVVKNVWIRATATDDDNASAKYSITTPFGIDNQSPITSHDYDGLWHNQNFAISLRADDADGIGVASISYILNSGNKQEITIDGQASALVNITTESRENILEYWSVDKLGNEESHKTLSNIKLDKTAPVFSDWEQEPEDLTEDTLEAFRVSVRVTDGDGSGLEGKVPQIDYYIGTHTQYDGYENMLTEDGRVWHFDILEPVDTWDAHRGEHVHYKVKSEDVAGNTGESMERRELIDDINDLPTISITSRFNVWEKELLRIEAESSDTDGTITGVQFEYSFDKSVWIPIGSTIATAPYLVEWDTEASIPEAQTVWVQATATDDGGASATDTYPTDIGIDNQLPTTSDDYDGLWHTADFAIALTASDGSGIGVTATNYILNEGDEKNLSSDGQPWVTEEGINQLEYWSVDGLGNAEVHHKLENIKLDKTSPVFADWIQDPADLTENSAGLLRVSVRTMDAGGSGLTGKIPQFSYHIGLDTQYSEYQDMMKGGVEDVWYYDIPEPIESWDAYRGKHVYYKVRVVDIAGNVAESAEQKELIDDINDPPTVSITSRFAAWETGSLTIDAESSDTDGTIDGVQFEYSLNKLAWTPIGATVNVPPYSVQWDTTASIPAVEQTVWVKAITTDDDGRSVEYVIPSSFKVDNQAPVTGHDYDGLWRKQDFVINLRANDGDGIGVASISYRLNFGDRQDVPIDGQVSIPVSITTESHENTLEYWSMDRLGNEESHNTLPDIKLDRTAPGFLDWAQDPVDLTEDTAGRFRVSVRAIDEAGSGLVGKIPQIDYHIGADTQYDGYENMISEDGRIWHFDIPEPTDTWDAHRAEYVYYKVRVEDIAGNVAESSEQEELIDSINDAPVVSVTSTFEDWEGGRITIEASASDVDGSVPSVQFDYSTDAAPGLPGGWTLVGVTIAEPPRYSVAWDTKTAIPELAKTVWIRATAIDADDSSVSMQDVTPKSFGIDNQVSTFGDWTKSPQNLTENTKGALRVQVNVDDGAGSGVAKVELAYRIGTALQRPFREMTRESGNLWYHDIPEPAGTWDQYRGETLYYRARATDAVGNESPETTEQQELIDDINDPPRGLITSTYKDWERLSVSVQAEVTDDDGEVVSVQFQYSPDNVSWTNIGAARTKAPYIVTWDSTVIDADPEVWLKAVITDDDGAPAEAIIAESFGIDNKSPTFTNWRHTPANLTEDSTESFFSVEVDITDVGSGLDTSQIQLDYRIGMTGYVGYTNMFRKTGNTWFYEIPRPGDWASQAGKTLYYRARAADIAGNVAESEERSEFIDPTTGSISGTIAPRESWFSAAKVTAQQNGVDVKQVSVSQINGSYSITGLRPGSYRLVVTAVGYGTYRSEEEFKVDVGVDKTVPEVVLYTYAVEKIVRTQGGSLVFKDAQLKEYTLVIDSNDLARDGKVVLGFSGSEPTGITNPEVHLLGTVGVGFEGRSLTRSLELIMPRPVGITDGKSVMTFIYNRTDYRFVDRRSIAAADATITITIAPEDVQNFSDQNHTFASLDKTSDTVFYVIITRFDEPPQISSSDLGIVYPQLSAGQVTDYRQPSITTADRAIALIIPGITSRSDDFANIISDLRAMKDKAGTGTNPYYDQVLVFNYEAKNTIASNGNFLMTELADVLPPTFDGKIDVVAHGMGGLVARSAISNDGDQYIGSLTMLGTPNAGVDEDLLKAGFANFLKKTPSDPAWTYYRDGWWDMLPGSLFLSELNNQAQVGNEVDTHYYAIAASDPGAATQAGDNDGLVYLQSVDFTSTTRFPNIEQPIPETMAFQEVDVTLPLTEGTRFMSRTRHMAMIDFPAVREKITTHLRGKSGYIIYDKYDGDLFPDSYIEPFTVTLKNGGTETVYGVSAKLSTQSIYIRKESGVQGIERDAFNFGDIPANTTKDGIFSFYVSSIPASAIGQSVTFTLIISNSRDNSISIEEFSVSLGGNLVQIALDAQTGEPIIDVDVRSTLPNRPENDDDIAVEPGELMGLSITLKNNSPSSTHSVTATLKTDDTRVIGRTPVYTGSQITSWTTVDMAVEGIPVIYGTIYGNATKALPFRFVKINDDVTLANQTQKIQIPFTLEIESGTTFIGSDEFNIPVGADIIVTRFDPDDDLKPGGGSEDIDVDLRNITANDAENVEVKIDWEPSVVDVDDDDVVFNRINASGGTEKATFRTAIDEGFIGYVLFTLEIRVLNDTVNIEHIRYYFGMRSQYVIHWITDDEDNDNIAEPGEDIKFQIARWNPSDETAENVEVELGLYDTADEDAIEVTEYRGDYGDISVYETENDVEESDDEYEFTVAAESEFENNPDDYPDFDLKGHEVKFTLRIEEDNDDMGIEKRSEDEDFTFTMRIGGIIRYLPRDGFSNFIRSIDDDQDSDRPNNNGNGIPEPGEIIDIEVTLINITDDITPDADVEDVEAELEPVESRVRVVGEDKLNFGNMDDGDEQTETYRVEIYSTFEGNRITFELNIEGDIDGIGNGLDLGTDVFVIPVRQ